MAVTDFASKPISHRYVLHHRSPDHISSSSPTAAPRHGGSSSLSGSSSSNAVGLLAVENRADTLLTSERTCRRGAKDNAEVVMRQGAERLDIQVKRAYEPPAAADGVRILVDRLW